ncbi:ankyrin repeat domain protein [Nitzschia inconspicua]|uniref:Ankyrin repeat domain protein n=1 Tax=Nitzschia inconspicua TaxID=303405 RepID=A0A9K3Q3I5_9STRA|nr:ankyrin repeat domain protein [Nitzschia inconspicua]
MMSFSNANDDRLSGRLPLNQGTHERNTTAVSMESQLSSQAPTRDEMNAVFQFCRKNLWTSVLNSVRNNPRIATTNMTMQNNITTTIIHQAITSKGDTSLRAKVVEEILCIAPDAAMIKNGYGSLPLHVIAQRNTKIDAKAKERLIRKLLQAFPGALTQQGGVGLRTPLHIIFTDYVSPRLTEDMIQQGAQACFMRDKKGFLPIHVACSRHCSPEKLQMLLEVNPGSLYATTNDGDGLLDLATKHSTKSHPNYALIDDLRRRLQLSIAPHHFTPKQVSSTDSNDDSYGTSDGSPASVIRAPAIASGRAASKTTNSRKRKRKVTADDNIKSMVDNTQAQANLLLQFSRQTHDDIKNFASV